MKGLFFTLSLLVLSDSLANVITFSKALYIPGEYFSLMNFTYDVGKIDDYLDVDIKYQLAQVKIDKYRYPIEELGTSNNIKAASYDQGNSIYDFFIFDGTQYSTLYPCYYSAITYLSSLYSQFEPCQGGCNFQADMLPAQNNTSFDLMNYSDQLSLIVDNTFYPCKGGVYQSQVAMILIRSFSVDLGSPWLIEVYLYQTITLSFESNFDFDLIIKIVFVVMLQVLIFLFACIMIMVNKLNNKKKKLKALREQFQDLDVLSLNN